MKKILLYLFLIQLTALHSEENKPEAQEKPVEPPDPQELKSDWWDYFKVDTSKLPIRISVFQEKLGMLKDSLNEKEHEDFFHLIDRASLNLNMLLDGKKKKETFEPVKLILLDAYSLDQYLEVAKTLNRLNQKINEANDDFRRQKRMLSQLQSDFDETHLLYTTSPKGSPQRLKYGLELIVLRSEIALNNDRLSSIRNRAKLIDAERDKIKSELNFAATNLVFDNLSSDELEEGLQKASGELNRAKTDLLRVEKKAFQARGDDPTNSVLQRLWDQKVLLGQVVLETAKSQQVMQEIKYHLYLIANHVKTYSTHELQVMINQWKEMIEDAKADIGLWEETIKDELERIGKDVAQISKDKDLSENKSMELSLNLHIEIDRAQLAIQELKQQLENASLLIKQVESKLIFERGYFEAWGIWIGSTWSKFIIFIQDIGNTKLFEIRESPVTLRNFFQAIFILFMAILLSKIFRTYILADKRLSKNLSSSTAFILNRTIHYLLLTIGFLIALSWIGLDFSNFIIIAGALGVGIGFGLQSIVSNVISGFMILFQRNLKIGDIIEMESNLIGRVAEIKLQNTRIHTFEGIDVIVPNSNFTSQRVINWTLHEHCRRFRIAFGVSYGTDKEVVRKAVVETVSKLPCTIKNDVRYPDPQVWFVGFGDSSMDFELAVWVNLLLTRGQGTAQSIYLWEIDNALRENNIDVPFPQIDVHIKEMAKPCV